MGKASNGAGSIYQRCNKCSVKMDKGKCPECGGRDGLWLAIAHVGWKLNAKGERVRDRRTIYGKKKADVEAELDKIKAARQNGTLASAPEKITLAEYLERWATNAAAHRVQPVTLELYRFYIDHHINPKVGHVLLQKLTPLDLQSLYSVILDQGATRTATLCHQVLHSALKQAVKWGLLARNPAADVDKPRYRTPERNYLSLEQVANLVDHLQGTRLFALFYLALATGCRRGELCAVRWEDVDWEKRVLQIRRTAEQVNGRQVVFTEPKTAKSKRAVTLPAEAIAALKEHRRRQLEERLAAGQYWEDQHGLIFCKKTGAPLVPDYVSHRWNEIRDKAGCPGVTLHDLRHTHATMLLAAGESVKAISARLGHSTTQLTLDLYSHVTPEMQESVTRRLDALLPSASSQKKS